MAIPTNFGVRSALKGQKVNVGKWWRANVYHAARRWFAIPTTTSITWADPATRPEKKLAALSAEHSRALPSEGKGRVFESRRARQ